MLNSVVHKDAYCQNLSNSLIKFLLRENLIVKKFKWNSRRVGTLNLQHMYPLLSSLFLSTYCSIILVLNTWRRRWNTWTDVNIIWFHVRQNCQKLLNSFTIFSSIFWKSSCEENVSLLYLKFAPVDSQSCMFDGKFYPFEIIMYHHFNSVSISSHVWNLFTFGTRCRHTKNKWITQVSQILISCKPLLSFVLCLKILKL